jgi:hypothetical protein
METLEPTPTTSKHSLMVRITVTGNTANTAAHIEEIKVYQSTGTPTATPSPTPTAAPILITYSGTGSTGNGLWTQAGSNLTPSQCAFYVSKHISYIYMQVGYWKFDSSVYLGINF